MRTEIKDVVQDCNLNFLVGSGLSAPYLKTLGAIEQLLSSLQRSDLSENQKSVIRCCLYKNYFDGVMVKNCGILADVAAAEPYAAAYRAFITTINSILLMRKSTILGKEANIFTTNIDVFLEKAIDRVGMECNDGFGGRFEPTFSTSNFKKAHSRRSLQYDNLSEIPTANLIKLHGSLTWALKGTDTIVFSPSLSCVSDLENIAISPNLLLQIDETTTLESLAIWSRDKNPDASLDAFLLAYGSLQIVNPTKSKFEQSLMNQTHYEMLRIYANELEKENTVLFVLGFSFSDEHIRDITLRAAISNPTLTIYVIAYDSPSATDLRIKLPEASIRNRNIEIIRPSVDEDGNDKFTYDFARINNALVRFFREDESQASIPASQSPARK